MADISVDKVREFQNLFLDRLRTTHQTDVIDTLASGIINDEVTTIIERIAKQVGEGMDQN